MPDNVAAHDACGANSVAYWAKRGKKQVGPFSSRCKALAAFYAANPFNKPLYLATAKANEVMTGYGAEGPFFDMRWHPALKLPD
jgi:hypothetical protein